MYRTTLGSILPALLLISGAALTWNGKGEKWQERGIRITGLQVFALPDRSAIVFKDSFEGPVADNVPANWLWDKRNTDAECRIDDTTARSGKRSLFISNGTPFGAHVYGTLWLKNPLPLKAGQTYTLSAYILCEDPGIGWIGGGSHWQFRLPFVFSADRWKKIQMTFQPSPDDILFTLRIVTESPTKGLWLDDLQLEEGETPTLFLSEDHLIGLEAEETAKTIKADGPFSLAFNFYTASPLTSSKWTVRADGATVFETLLNLKPGFYRIFLQGSSQGLDERVRRIQLRCDGVKGVSAEDAMEVRFLSPISLEKRLQTLRHGLERLSSLIGELRGKGMDVRYPVVGERILRTFIEYVKEDLKRGEIERARDQVSDLEQILSRWTSRLEEAIRGGDRLPSVPWWTGRTRPRIVGSSFIGEVRDHKGRLYSRPIFFVGYGHFGQVKNDVDIFPQYGVNMIQIEFGPNSVFPLEGVESHREIVEVQKVLNRAASVGVAVNLLISPHYFPEWMLRKYPHLNKRRDGFLRYCLHAPEGQELLKCYATRVASLLGHQSALHSICLTNEPINVEEPCPYGQALWHKWLQERHGDIDTLNQRWGSNYKSIESIPLPDPFRLTDVSIPSPLWYDFVRFNQDFFTRWHKILADEISRYGSGLPVHTKAMSWTFLNENDVRFGVDAYLFSRFSPINGNDSVNFFSFGRGEFAQGWLLNAMAYDLQRSCRDAPVFNSENHLIPDREVRRVPAEHIRAALWQGAIYGQSATTIWVWERTYDPKSDFAGSIMHRPLCAEAVGLTCLDLNRLALEVTEFQKAKPHVTLLHSLSSLVWDGVRHSDARNKLYTALTFHGVKVGFVTERMLEDGIIPQTRVLFVPSATHLSRLALSTLSRYKGRVIWVGSERLLSRDEYGHQTHPPDPTEQLTYIYPKTTARDLWRQIAASLSRWGLSRELNLVDTSDLPAWGVDWKVVPFRNSLLINLCNYNHETMELKILHKGRPVVGWDLLKREPIAGTFRLASLQVRLVRVPVAARP